MKKPVAYEDRLGGNRCINASAFLLNIPPYSYGGFLFGTKKG